MNEKNQKSLFHKRPLIAVCLIFLLIIAALVFIGINQEQKPDSKSEKIFRQAFAAQLHINNPDSLTDISLRKITSFSLINKELRDIRLLEKCTNLQQLTFQHIYFPEKDKPKWMKLLAKLGIYDLKDRFVIDLRPLAKLTNLQSLQLSDMPIKNIQALSGLVNLRYLWLINVPVDDLGPLRSLTNLTSLDISYSAQISDLEPLKDLINLKELRIDSCIKLSNKQIEDLQKALPNLEIIR